MVSPKTKNIFIKNAYCADTTVPKIIVNTLQGTPIGYPNTPNINQLLELVFVFLIFRNSQFGFTHNQNYFWFWVKPKFLKN